MPRFQDIPQISHRGSYSVNIRIDHIEETIAEYNIDLEPEFQRAHVWQEHQQSAYVEYILRGGYAAREVYLNCPGHRWDEGCVVVDGKQRLTAMRRFFANEIPAFGYCFSEYTDRPCMMRSTLQLYVNHLETDSEVLQWYLDLNSGGTPHTEAELEKVREMLKK